MSDHIHSELCFWETSHELSVFTSFQQALTLWNWVSGEVIWWWQFWVYTYTEFGLYSHLHCQEAGWSGFSAKNPETWVQSASWGEELRVSFQALDSPPLLKRAAEPPGTELRSLVFWVRGQEGGGGQGRKRITFPSEQLWSSVKSSHFAPLFILEENKIKQSKNKKQKQSRDFWGSWGQNIIS